MLLWLAWMEGGWLGPYYTLIPIHSFLSKVVGSRWSAGKGKGLLLVIDGHLLTVTTGNSPSFLEGTLLEVEIQGGPSASGKGYVDSKFEVAFSCKFTL